MAAVGCAPQHPAGQPGIDKTEGATYSLDTLPGIRSPQLELADAGGVQWGRILSQDSPPRSANPVSITADSVTFVAPADPRAARVRLAFTNSARTELRGIAVQTIDGVAQSTIITAKRIGGISPTLRSLASLQPFAPDVIANDSGGVSFGSMRADGREFFFTRHTPNWARHTIMVSSSPDGEHWSAPTKVAFSGQFSDREPRLSPDGLQLWFSSPRPRPGTSTVQKTRDLWMVERSSVGAAWSAPRLAPNVNTDAEEFSPVVTADGTLYFVSNRSGGLGVNDVYRARREGSGFASVENLGAAINSAAHETNVFVTPDDQVMIISADERPDSEGGDDLYVSERRDGRWTPTRHLGAPINSFAYEYGPSLSEDRRWLYFTSHRRGTAAIYRVPSSLLRLSR